MAAPGVSDRIRGARPTGDARNGARAPRRLVVAFRAGRRGLDVTHNRAWFAVAVVLVLAGVAGLAVEQLRADGAADEASAPGRAAPLPPTPDQAIRTVLEMLAAGDPAVCAVNLTPAASTQLAAATGAPDCPAAVHALAGRVVDPVRYPGPDNDAIAVSLSPDGQTGSVDACRLSWAGASEPGPQLGRLDVVRGPDRGYQVVGVAPC